MNDNDNDNDNALMMGTPARVFYTWFANELHNALCQCRFSSRFCLGIGGFSPKTDIMLHARNARKHSLFASTVAQYLGLRLLEPFHQVLL
jgi:hypothetical protein